MWRAHTSDGSIVKPSRGSKDNVCDMVGWQVEYDARYAGVFVQGI
jgi:hypothetical protein